MLQELENRIGKDAVIQLLKEFGGLKLYIPVKMTLEHRLTLCIGYDQAKKLSYWYGGCDLQLPIGVKYRIEDKIKEARRLQASGLGRFSIAKNMGVSRRTVNRYLSSEEAVT